MYPPSKQLDMRLRDVLEALWFMRRLERERKHARIG
jgi:hypothetical protein